MERGSFDAIEQFRARSTQSEYALLLSKALYCQSSGAFRIRVPPNRSGSVRVGISVAFTQPLLRTNYLFIVTISQQLLNQHRFIDREG